MDTNDQSLKSLLSNLVNEISQLVRQELRLAQAEANEKLSQVQNGLIAVVAGLLLAFCALLILLQALVIALSNLLPAWLASIVVGGVVAVIAFALVKGGQNNLRAANLVPERTIESVRKDKDMVMEKAK